MCTTFNNIGRPLEIEFVYVVDITEVVMVAVSLLLYAEGSDSIMDFTKVECASEIVFVGFIDVDIAVLGMCTSSWHFGTKAAQSSLV